MSLKLADAEYYRHDGYPMLRVAVAGRTAELAAEVKPAVYRAGLVPLGGEFDDLCPAAEVTVDDGRREAVRYCSADPRLFRLYDAFLRAAADGTFAPGPVAIPD